MQLFKKVAYANLNKKMEIMQMYSHLYEVQMGILTAEAQTIKDWCWSLIYPGIIFCDV